MFGEISLMLDPAKIGRLGELDAPPGRASRVRKISGEWYFATREGKLAGPFTSRVEAHKAAEDFVRFAMIYSGPVLNRLLDYLSADNEASEATADEERSSQPSLPQLTA